MNINDTAAAWRTVQCYIAAAPDGIPGGETLGKLAAILKCAQTWSAVQHAVRAEPDNIPGIRTARAVVAALGAGEPIYTQAEIRTGRTMYGMAGKVPLVQVAVPEGYPITYEGRKVRTITVHEKIADQVKAILEEIARVYEGRMEAAPGICIYDGSYNDRSTTGGGVKSIHAWGLALDFDAGENPYAPAAAKGARLARPEYDAFRRIILKHGGFSLGERSDRDWMHFQFAAWC